MGNFGAVLQGTGGYDVKVLALKPTCHNRIATGTYVKI